MDEPIASLFHDEALRILEALRERARYRYVQPVVQPAPNGWKIVSPCCSRNVDPSGGVIDVAWIEHGGDGTWRLHSRDHENACWDLRGEGLALDALLDIVCLDSERVFWP